MDRCPVGLSFTLRLSSGHFVVPLTDCGVHYWCLLYSSVLCRMSMKLYLVLSVCVAAHLPPLIIPASCSLLQLSLLLLLLPQALLLSTTHWRLQLRYQLWREGWERHRLDGRGRRGWWVGMREGETNWEGTTVTPEEHHSKRVDIDTSPYDTNSIKHTLKTDYGDHGWWPLTWPQDNYICHWTPNGNWLAKS